MSGEISRETQRKRIKNGTHHLLGGEIQRKNARKRIDNGSHNLLGPETNLKRIEDGTHHLQVKGMMTALNIETNEVHRITKELYYSRRDIYFHNRSNVYKEWKKNKETQK